jgi:hypothetical protein
MSKKKNKLTNTAPQQKLQPEIKPHFFSFLDTFKKQAIALIIIGFVLNINTIYNQYALDDGIVLVKNKSVQNGFAGIKDILTTDAYYGFYKEMNAENQLQGGRYRPLSIVTFAIEQQLFGDNTFVRHFFNVVFYLLSVVLLLKLLSKYLLKHLPDIAFLTCLLFLIHPLHTEVVANIKSRDEIFSFLFIMLTFIYLFRYTESKTQKDLVFAAGSYFLALLSKEWGITLVALVPLSLIVFKKENISNAIYKCIPFFIVAFVYLLMRVKFVGLGSNQENTEILNNPFYLATASEKMATQIFVLLKYLLLLLFPHPLSADYSYNTIYYRNFASPDVLMSIAVYIGIIVWGIYLYNKKHPLAFALAFFLAHLALVSNFIFDIGASMGERLVYHSSLGIVLIVAWGIVQLCEKYFMQQKNILLLIITPIVLLSGYKTITRNAEWKNDKTLFITDAKTVPHSIMANGNAGKSFIEMAEEAKKENDTILQYQLLDSADFYLRRSIKNHPKNGYYLGYLNLGYIYFIKTNYDSCEYFWNMAAKTFPRERHRDFWKTYDVPLANVYHVKGNQAGVKKDFIAAAAHLEKAVFYQPNNSLYWTDLGGANYENKNYQRAYECWTRAVQLDPANKQAQGGLNALQYFNQEQKK